MLLSDILSPFIQDPKELGEIRIKELVEKEKEENRTRYLIVRHFVGDKVVFHNGKEYKFSRFKHPEILLHGSMHVYRDVKTELLRCWVIVDSPEQYGIDVPVFTYFSDQPCISSRHLEDICFMSIDRNDVLLYKVEQENGKDCLFFAAYKESLVKEVEDAIMQYVAKDYYIGDFVDLENDSYHWRLLNRYSPEPNVSSGDIISKNAFFNSIDNPLGIILYNNRKIPLVFFKIFELSALTIGDDIEISDLEIAVFLNDNGEKIYRIFSKKRDSWHIDNWDKRHYHYELDIPEPNYEDLEEKRMYEVWFRDAFEDDPDAQWGRLD